MTRILALDRFDGFGACSLTALEPSRFEVRLCPDRKQVRRQLRFECPLAPGIYGMISADGELLYVGKSKCLRKRLLSYFGPQGRGEKSERIVARAACLAWETSEHEFLALVRELDLIHHRRPHYNVQGKPGRSRRVYICLGRAPAPYLYTSPAISKRTQATFGPLPAGRAASAVRRLNDLLKLRDCPDRVPMRFRDQRELFDEPLTPQCLRHALATCSAPCAAACSTLQYSRQVGRARSFLNGKDRSLLETLWSALTAASECRQFERAATLRDVWLELMWLAGSLDRLVEVRTTYHFIYPVQGVSGRDYWILIREGELLKLLDAPQCAHTRRQMIKHLDEHYGPRGPVRLPGHSLSHVLLVSAWFRRHPEELQKVMSPVVARQKAEQHV